MKLCMFVKTPNPFLKSIFLCFPRYWKITLYIGLQGITTYQYIMAMRTQLEQEESVKAQKALESSSDSSTIDNPTSCAVPKVSPTEYSLHNTVILKLTKEQLPLSIFSCAHLQHLGNIYKETVLCMFPSSYGNIWNLYVNKFLSSSNSPTASSSWNIGSILGLWIVSLLISQSLDAGLQKNSLGVKWKW